MRDRREGTYVGKVKRRSRIQCLILTAMPVYMVCLVEMGGGDSRVMTDLAQKISRLLFFGGIIYMISGIVRNRKLLNNRLLLKEQMQTEQDERNQYLHDKSGGLVMDILLVCLMFFTWTAALFHMAVFYTFLAVLVLAAVLKALSYCYYSRI